MYTIPNAEEELFFRDNTETVIKVLGQTVISCRTFNHFNSVVKDNIDSAIEMDAYTGSYSLNAGELVVQKIFPIKGTVIAESEALQLLVCKTTIERLINLAKACHCTKLLIFTTDSVMAESLFMCKFNLIKLKSDGYEVRSELSI